MIYKNLGSSATNQLTCSLLHANKKFAILDKNYGSSNNFKSQGFGDFSLENDSGMEWVFLPRQVKLAVRPHVKHFLTQFQSIIIVLCERCCILDPLTAFRAHISMKYMPKRMYHQNLKKFMHATDFQHSCIA